VCSVHCVLLFDYKVWHRRPAITMSERPRFADRRAVAQQLWTELRLTLGPAEIPAVSECINTMLRNRDGSNGHQFNEMRRACAAHPALVGLITRCQTWWDKSAVVINTHVRSAFSAHQWARRNTLLDEYNALSYSNGFYDYTTNLPSAQYHAWIHKLKHLEAEVGTLHGLRAMCPEALRPYGPSTMRDYEAQAAAHRHLTHLFATGKIDLEQFIAEQLPATENPFATLAKDWGLLRF